MRRIPALLCAAGLAAAPASAVAESSSDPWSTPQSPTVEKLSWSTSKGRLGVMVMSLTPELRKHFGSSGDRGVLVAQVEPGTPAAKAGIEVGDVLVEIGGRKIDTASDVLTAIEGLGKGDHVKVTALRDRASRSLEATLTSNAPARASWSPRWLRDWIEEPTWYRDWPKLFDRTNTDTAPEPASSWLRKLRELVEPKTSGPQRS